MKAEKRGGVERGREWIGVERECVCLGVERVH